MHRFPLHKGVNIEKRPEQGHPGLWYDKFAHCWEEGFKKFEKGQWIGTVTGSCGEQDALERQAKRLSTMIEALGGHCIDRQTTGPFVSGLGRDHPVENGFLWHHTLGTPYLSGSSVKGMVRAWARQWQGEDEESKVLPILGSDLPSKRQAGSVVFFDALPIKPLELRADVMTPHYNEYYQEGKVPGDWISPVPIPFLTVGEGAVFRFAAAPRRGVPSSEAVASCKKALEWLTEALEWIGAGAKTAAGYGRFGAVPPPTSREYQKREKVKVTLYKDERGRWCGRTDDGTEGSIFGSPPSEAALGQSHILHVRVAKPLEFQWAAPPPKGQQQSSRPGARGRMPKHTRR